MKISILIKKDVTSKVQMAGSRCKVQRSVILTIYDALSIKARRSSPLSA